MDDPTAWQIWWMYNQERFLGRSTFAIDGKSSAADRSETRVFGRLSRDEVQAEVIPAMTRGLEVGGNLRYVRAGILGLASAAESHNQGQFDFLLRHFLTVGDHTPIHHTAAVALGILGSEGSLDTLRDLALNTAAGKKLVAAEEVPIGLRAHAAYGLGMLGNGSSSSAERSGIVSDLIGLLENEASSTDLQVAAITALGMVPLELDAAATVCICGTCEVEGPETSFQSQVTYLMRYFTADREFDPTVRAHTATALGRLVEAGLRDAKSSMLPHVEEIKGGVVDILMSSLQRYAKQPEIVQESAVLALGLVGDSDNDNEDKWIRHELGRMASHGDPLCKRYAMISLAEVGGRPGRGEDSWAGAAEARADLLQRMSRGKRGEKAWAGLALGVLGHHLTQNHQELDANVDRALRLAAKKAKSSEDLGAYALALGLRRHTEAAPVLTKKLGKLKDEAAQGWVALGLGLMDAPDALESIVKAMNDEDASPVLWTRGGYALGMLDDGNAVGKIAEMIDATDDIERQAALACALGLIGDASAVKVLEGVLEDDDNRGVHRQQAMRALARLAHPGQATWFSAFARGLNYHAQTATLTSEEGVGLLDRP